MNEMIENAINCMEFPEFYLLYFDLLNMMKGESDVPECILEDRESKYQQIVNENLEKQQEKIDVCYRELECTEEEQEDLQKINSENVKDILANICSKICDFLG